MATDNKNSITGFNVITTNDGDSVLNNVTRDDIIDIIVEIKKISKVSKFTEIIDLFDKHIKQYNKLDPLDYRYDLITEVCNLLQTTIPVDGIIPSTNPHNTKIEHLVGNILDRLYALWLLRGNSESLDSFRQVIFNVFKYGSVLDIFNKRRDDLLISVAEFRSYFERFHEALLDKYDDAIFIISQSEIHWPGSIQGYQITSANDDTDRTVLVREDVDTATMYTCSIDISPRFKSANVYVDVTATTDMSVSYRIGDSETWLPFTDKVFIDIYKQPLGNEIIDILDPQTYRYRLPSSLDQLLTSKLSLENELNVTIHFRILPEVAIPSIYTVNDVSIVVDGTDQISDDIYKLNFYADPPHKNIIDKFISHDLSTIHTPTYYTTNCLCSSTDTFVFNKSSGSICFRYQPTAYNLRSPVGDEVVRDETTVQELVSFVSDTGKLLTITLTISGKHIVGTGSTSSYSSIDNMYLSLVTSTGDVYPLVNLLRDTRSVYSGVLSYINGNNVSYTYRNDTGVVATNLLELTEVISASATVKPAILVGGDKFGNIIGVQELVYYSSAIGRASMEMYLMDKV